MDLIEGISNEVLLSFIVTITLLTISVFYILRNSPSSIVGVGSSLDSRGSREHVVSETPQNNVNTSEDDVRRRFSSHHETIDQRVETNGETNSDEIEKMVIKVKHNENVQTFTVSKNITVLDLKR